MLVAAATGAGSRGGVVLQQAAGRSRLPLQQRAAADGRLRLRISLAAVVCSFLLGHGLHLRRRRAPGKLGPQAPPRLPSPRDRGAGELGFRAWRDRYLRFHLGCQHSELASLRWRILGKVGDERKREIRVEERSDGEDKR
jgi:hypothetical protein